MKTVILGVCGSISAYRAADLARDLMRSGCSVHVCLTDSAQKFVTPLLFETLTGNPCLSDTFEEPERGRMAHLDLARKADLVVVAPATANLINQFAQGLAGDMLTTMILAYRGPILIAPAMNPAMYANEVTQRSLTELATQGVVFVEPTEGDVASGEFGQGKLAQSSAIHAEAIALLSKSSVLSGKKVCITGGPTHEAIDDVRFISNRSSGKMAVALARAAYWLGAEVTLILGPTSVTVPNGISVRRVKSAEDMGSVLTELTPECDWVIGAAAVADYKVANRVSGKLRRTEASLHLELVPNPDLIQGAAHLASKTTKVVGFAAEPTSDLSVAASKLKKKGLWAIASNDVSQPNIGFESDQNEISLIFADGKVVHSGLRSKLGCGFWMWESLLAHQD